MCRTRGEIVAEADGAPSHAWQPAVRPYCPPGPGCPTCSMLRAVNRERRARIARRRDFVVGTVLVLGFCAFLALFEGITAAIR